MGELHMQWHDDNTPEGAITVLRADDDIQVSGEVLQHDLHPSVTLSLELPGGIKYELTGYDSSTKTYTARRA